jgi:glycosyltransferase involved in cell wall biosynthesis
MRIAFLLQAHPEPGDTDTNLYADLVEAFVKYRHQVVVITAAKEGQPTTFRKEGNTEVLRVKTMKLFQVSPVIKGVANILLPYQFIISIKKHLLKKDFDLIISPTPPITFMNVIKFLKRRSLAKCFLILRDIFPQNARDLGMLTNPLLFAYFRRKEKKLYAVADYIGCMSQGNIDYVIKHNPEVSPKKISLLPNWQKVYPLLEKNGSVKAKYGLAGKYIAIFGGNIGEPQKIENIIALANEYRNKSNIVFLVIGEGAKKKFLEQMVIRNELNNVIIKNKIPRSDYQELVNNSDIGLISLNEKFTIPNIPSKTLSYFNAKVPILAAIDAHTDYGKILEESGAGLWSVTGDIERYKQNFDMLYNDPSLRKQMGENGYAYLLKYLTVNTAYDTIIGHTATINEIIH